MQGDREGTMRHRVKRPPQELSRFKDKLFQVGVIGYR